MNILLVGSGGREHAILRKLQENKTIENIYVCPGSNAFEGAISTGIAATNIAAQLAYAREKKVDYAVITPDNPLALGAVDQFQAAGIPCFGPDKKAARIESSKAFAKALMKKYRIPTAAYEVFDSSSEALAYLEKQKMPIVIKADGLALGKGVVIAQTLAQAKEAVIAMLEKEAFGEAGKRIIIEEWLTGPEVSVLSFTDGETIVPMVSAMDHKRAYDHDEGPNTGGMGAIAPNPYYTEAIAAECMETIYLPTLAAMRVEGAPFRGCLYFALMLTPQGVKVIEYNARFGDPETQAVLPLMTSDLLAAMQACTNGTLAQTEISFSQEASCCVVMAAEGYPGHYEKGHPLHFRQEEVRRHCLLAGVRKEGENYVSSGGRVLGVLGTGVNLKAAVQTAYERLKQIDFPASFYRHDIGKKAIAKEEEA